MPYALRMSETITKKTAWAMLAVVGGLLAVCAVIGVVLIGQLNSQAAQSSHDRIVAICEDGLADPYGSDLGAMTSCMEDLTR